MLQVRPNAVAIRMAVKSQNQEGIILLAEDREEDAELLKLAFRRAGILNPIVVVRDGDEVLSYLLGMDKYENSPLPLLLLLDLKMPNRNGFEALQWIREHPTLKALRIIVMTVSESIYDVNRAYHIGANSFLIKSSDVIEMIEQAKQIKAHWIDTPAPDLVRLQVLRKAS
jgi:CheY-like chemotaxis protein